MQGSTDSKINILLIGPLPIKGDHLGGAKAAFSQLVSDFESFSNVKFKIINLSRSLRDVGRFRRIQLNILKFLNTILSLIKEGKYFDVWAINVSPKGSFALLPCARLISMIYRKPIVVRMFGGSLVEDLSVQNVFVKKLYGWALNGVSVLTLETQYLIDKHHHMSNVVWFPNTRNIEGLVKLKSECKKYIFLSQIRKEKGVSEILEAARLVKKDCQIDLYGSVLQPELLRDAEVLNNVFYKGELALDSVASTLSQYDALLLPTYWEGEGHPGVIIEAFQCGLPVIVTDWKQIAEIVTHNKDGILIEHKNSESLASAMNLLTENSSLFRSLREGALETGEKFRSTRWHNQFVEWCQMAISSKRSTR